MVRLVFLDGREQEVSVETFEILQRNREWYRMTALGDTMETYREGR